MTATGVAISLDVDTINVGQRLGRRAGEVAGSLAIGAGMWRAGTACAPDPAHRPSRYLNPGVADSERALAARGTTLVGTVKSGALVELLANGSWGDEAAASARAVARRAIAQAVGPLSARSAAIVAAIVIGDRAGLDDAVERQLQDAGTFHVIAISGGNIALLAGLLLAAFRMAGMLGRLSMLSAIAVLTGYARIVGGGASVDRADLDGGCLFQRASVDQRVHRQYARPVAPVWSSEPLSVMAPAFILTCGATGRHPLGSRRSCGGGGCPTAADPRRRCSPLPLPPKVLMPVGARLFGRVTFAGLVLNFAAA